MKTCFCCARCNTRFQDSEVVVKVELLPDTIYNEFWYFHKQCIKHVAINVPYKAKELCAREIDHDFQAWNSTYTDDGTERKNVYKRGYKRRQKAITWTERADEMLISLYYSLDHQTLGDLIGCTKDAVIARAYKLRRRGKLDGVTPKQQALNRYLREREASK